MAEGDLFDDRVTSSTNVIFQSDSAGEAFDDDYTKVPQWWDSQEEIVISGLSGRFPESDNVKEFMENLYAGVDMVTEDKRRWDPGYYGLPKRHGKIKDLSKFDAEFFGFTPNQATDTDPQIRLLLQTAYECLYDAGVNPFALRGSKSGVFLGNSLAETAFIKISDMEQINGDALNGTMPLVAYHLIHHLDFKGPCMTVDAACSSSLLALQLAVDAIRTGQCDQAIIAGAHLTLSPNSHMGFMALGMLSPSSKCHSFDIRGDGYVRGECVGCIFIQKKSLARRVYATILHAKSNTDGFKEQGISFPSAGQQINLLRSTYKEAGLDPKEIVYVEAHGTGTKVGDPIECHAIKTVFAKNRDEPLLIGSIKSNTGHAEPASGILGLAKVIVSMEKGIIPKNLHFQQANPYIPSLTDGSLKVVSENTEWEPGLVGVSSFGFGGSNTHIILKANSNAEKLVHFDKSKNALPILLIHSSRTEKALENIFAMFEKENSDDLYLYNMLCEQSATPTNLFQYRGYTLISPQDPKKKAVNNIVKVADNSKSSIWYVFSGIGSQWIGMGRELMIMDVFRESVTKCSTVLEKFGISIIRLIMEGTEADFKDNPLNSLTCITAIQIALTDLLRFVGIKEEGIVGFSTGEIAASYADGCTDCKETMLIAYHVGQTILDSKHPQGAMAEVHMTLEQMIKRLPEGVFISSKNHNNAVSVAGDAEKVNEFVKQLTMEGYYAKHINSAGVAFHSPHLRDISEKMRNALLKILPSPKHRTKKWITSSIRNEKLDTYSNRYSSANFHLNNLMSMTNFDSALKRVPKNAIVVEISPDGIMQDLLKRGLFSGNQNIALMSSKLQKHETSVDFFLTSLGKIYQLGANFEIQKLYPKVQYPAPRGTPMLSHMFGWQHEKSWKVYKGALSKHQTGVNSFAIDPFASDSKDHYVLHHVFDGRPLYPFCGHIFLAWKTICKVNMVDFNKTPVMFENIRVIRATFVTKPVKFDVVLTSGKGDFEILEDGNLCAMGRIRILTDEENKQPFFLEKLQTDPSRMDKSDEKIELSSADIYKEFLLRGYEYGQTFRGIHSASNSGEDSTLLWTGNWVTFIDTLFQMFLIMEKNNSFIVPVRLRHLRIDPIRHNAAVQELDGAKIIPGRNIIELFGFIAGGVEACGLVSQTVRRRTHQQKVTFERNSFIPLFADNCLFETPDVQKQLHQYNDACRSLAVNGIRSLLEHGTHLPNKSIFEKISKVNVATVSESLLESTNEKDSSMLKMLNDLNQSTMATNGGVFPQKLSSHIKSSLANLENDKVWSFSWADRCIIDQMDILLQNTKGFFVKAAVLEPHSLMVTKKMHWVANLHPLVEAKFLLIGTSVEKQFTPEEQAGLNISFHDYNIDEEQTFEGMEKNQDVVVLDRLLHQKADIQKYLTKVKSLIRDDGFVLVNEVTCNFETAFFIEGLQMEMPEFPINGVRKYGLYYEHKDWCEIFEKSGYHIISWSSEQLMTTLYLLRKIPSYTMDPMYLKVDNDNEFKWIEPLQKAIDDRLNEPPGKTIIMYSNEIRDCGVMGMGICFKDEYKHNKTRSLMDLSLKNRTGPPAFNISDPEIQKMLKKDLLFNIYRDGVFGNFKHIPILEGQLYAYEETEHAYINNLIPGDLSSVTWVSSDNKYFEDKPKVDILSLASLYYAPLNFRDIMLASGRLPPDAIPKADRLDYDALLGLEFCGRLTKTGKRVMGLSTSAQGLATTLVVDSRFTFDVPEQWTMEEAATVPLAYSTAYYSLVVRGNMQRGEKVLIHSGSGGVGIASITVALSYGCEVFTTVGNDEKRTFLLARFPELDDKHICSSRTCDFELQIMQMTQGRGVDLILNSLSEDKLQASVRCLGQKGRFLEIGKFDLATNSDLGMSLFLKNASFHGVLLDSLTAPVLQPDWLIAVDLVVENAKKGIVKPLPATIFEMNQPVEAFRYMAQGKHIGKVILKIRDEESERVVLPKPIVVKAVLRATCHPQHVYILLGGLGGFGLELANWLVSRGCTKMIITSRNGIKTGYQARYVSAWRKAGVKCIVFTSDVSDKSRASQLMKEAQKMGSIGGIFNLAMVLNDTVFENSSVKNYQVTFAPKYHVTKNMDELARKMCGSELKWFVLFSSLTAARGNTGQTAYAFSNSAAERIIEQRRCDGLSGNVIQWGVVGDVGVIMETLGDNSTTIKGTLPQRMSSCLQIMDSILCLNYPMVSSFVKSDVESQKIGQDEDVGEAIARILGISDLSNINPDVNLGDLGLDSLMAIEIKQALERDFDLTLTLKDMRTLTLARLRDLAKAGKMGREQSADSQQVVPKPVPDETQKSNMMGIKFRMDFNSLRPDDPCKKINEVLEGRPLFFVHPIEGVATNLITLAKLLPYPCYCFQMTPDAPTDTMENLALFYTNQMKHVQPQGPYRIIGYSYGACIAFEMAAQLQHDYPNDPKIVESLIMLDGSHQYWKYFRQAYRKGYNIQSEDLLNDPLFETEILVNIMLVFTPLDYESTRKKFLAMNSFEERVNTVVEMIVSSGFLKDKQTVRYGLESYWTKMLMADKYNQKLNFNGNITLIRAKTSQIIENTIGKDYGLTEVSNGTVSTYVVDGDHDSFIRENGAVLCSKHIMNTLASGHLTNGSGHLTNGSGHLTNGHF